MNIGNKQIGPGNPCFIIAEAGVNHNGDINLAKQLIDIASESGADAVKFQTFTAESLVTKDVSKAEYQKETTGSEDSNQFQMLKKLELGKNDHLLLKKYAEEKGLMFLSTPFDSKSSDFLESLGIDAYKIPSGEVTNLPFLKHVAKKGKPMILSTGMSTLEEVTRAVKTMTDAGNRNIILLHCVTSYPTPDSEANIKAMLELQKTGVEIVGYSDHTMGIYAPLAAVALGAKVIEKHFTLDRNMEGPDHQASLEPGELKEMVTGIRTIEKMLGSGIKTPSPCEKGNISIIRKRIVAARDISAGELLSKENLALKRSSAGLEPSEFENLFGKKTKQDIKKDEPITEGVFQ